MMGVLWTRPALNLNLIVDPDGILEAPRAETLIEITPTSTTSRAGGPYGRASVRIHPNHPVQHVWLDLCR